jgi:hypothetical protein
LEQTLLWIFPQIFKGFKPLGKILRNSLKISLNLIFHNVNLYWHACINNLEVLLHVVNVTWFNNYSNERFNFGIELKPRYNIDWLQRYCRTLSCYSDTRGVIVVVIFRCFNVCLISILLRFQLWENDLKNEGFVSQDHIRESLMKREYAKTIHKHTIPWY